MKSRFPIGLVMMLAALMSLFPAAGTVLPAQAQGTCDAAQFITDVTVPDGTFINPGAAFVKTWRLKNIGVCQWTTAYSLVFASGTQMGSTTSVAFPNTVAPGQTVDLSVTLTAPTAGGTFRGFWQLKNSSGALFGIGANHANPFWVEIKVTGPTQNVTAYDFTDNMCAAQWSYDGGPILCPPNPNKLNFGQVQFILHPQLEDGTTSALPGLLTLPQNKYNSLIRGSFPVPDIFRGDHFQALVGCQFNAVNCFVTFELQYQKGDSLFTLFKTKEKYDGLMTQMDVDLTQIAGIKNARVVLTVLATGPAGGDRPLWVGPKIVRAVSAPIVTPTPVRPTAAVTPGTPTNVPGCNKAQFVTDVTVPDGTTFAPNAPFNKVWRLKNTGYCTWTTAYSLVFVSGSSMGGVTSLLTQSVVPGQTVDVGVNLFAPSLAGSYRGNWELMDNSGDMFGLGTNADQPFFVSIKVAGTPLPTVTPTTRTTPSTSTPTTTGAPTLTPTVTATPTSTTAPATATATATTAATATATSSSSTSNWSTFQNTKYAFSFKFPPGSTVSNQTDTTGHLDLPFTAGTNLLKKTLDVSVAEGLTTCKASGSNPNIPPTNVTFNGIQFLKETWSEGATSHMGDFTAYSTVKGNACITLTFFLWSVVPSVMETPPPVFDAAAETAVFPAILSTYGNQ